MSTRTYQVQRPTLQQGVTLVELLVALALGLAVLVGLSAVYVASKQSYRFQETSGRLQEDGTFALEIIARDLRMAGFAGCRGVQEDSANLGTYFPKLSVSPLPTAITGPNPLATVVPALALRPPLSPFNFIRGFDTVPAAMFATAPASTVTDSLFFSGGSSDAVSISAAMGSTTAALTIASNPAGWDPLKVYNMVVADCASGSLFAGQVNAGGTQISHAQALGNSLDAFSSNPIYGIDAMVMPVEWNFYYIATRSGATTPSLYRIFYNGNARDDTVSQKEVVSNVEAMKLHYGENLLGTDSVTSASCNLSAGSATCSATLQADTWRTTAAAVTDWSHVVAVRVGLMLVSADNSASVGLSAPTITLLGQSYTPPADSRLRKEFSTTVVLRNRVAAR